MIEIGGPVFVTGASGFVGRHIVQQLNQNGYRVRALVRRVPQPGFDPRVELVIGDLGKSETYAQSLEGASAVIHAALTDDLSSEPRATAALYDWSARAGVRKFVHLSSIVVYGNPATGTITEDTPPLPSADAYPRTKLAIEDALRARPGTGEIVFLRLGCVYGPGGGWWTEGLLNLMKRGRCILIAEGTGVANLIHVSDVASIVVKLLACPAAGLQVFNVTDGKPVTWKRYFTELEQILGVQSTVSMSPAEAREHARKWLKPSLARRVIRKLSGPRPIHPLDDSGIRTFTSRAVYSNHKAASTLAFAPAYDLASGMQSVRSQYQLELSNGNR